jgi:hypothetical protein
VPLYGRSLGSRVLVASGISRLLLLGSWPTGRSVGRWVGWSVGWLEGFGFSVGWLLRRSVGFVGRSVGCLVGWLVGRSVG